MFNCIKKEVAVFTVLIAFITTSLIFQYNLLAEDYLNVLYVLKEKSLIVALGYFSCTKVNNSLMIYTISSVTTYVFIQMLVYMVINLKIVCLNGVLLTVANPAVSIPFCLVIGIIFMVISKMSRKK